ncbi:C1 family peptidase [Bacteroides gallinaceum]|jgi:aminopeptidase C|uniref:Aminopeptidase n=2 Tax=Bacteroidaceae TaxID=815 RepID=A0ABT7X8V6_9BACE|nr:MULTISPECIES: C1 family peptidase [Bacteroidaceae]CCZ68864.1 peptidase C1-like family [Bacteroides sp. CAG:702]HJD11158.1 C1 family peptidase [Candidatus Phocaeicola caecigallinarum]MBD8040100.1 aminopeptidase [Phocaeicola intestinalis]MBM6720058.1 aminopeptidase [Bacteroides gallinaceum]MBM6945398.1 aminopeptidase [Bacteroides gallinaceum]
MNKLIAILAMGICFSNVYAKGPKKDKTEEEGFVFTTVKENPITSIKDQNQSSTCWSFSTLGFFESELLRLGKGEFDLSEMFVVHHTMEDRAVNYVRYHGDASFSPGGSFEDIVYCYENYGMVPQEAMPGIMYGDSLPNHNELDAVASGYVDAIAKGKLKKLSPVWKNGVCAIYDTYLGKCPEQFTYKGKTYTPRTFADEVLGLNMDDYVSLTSYTHHPFYKQFSIEVQDNWRNALSYNLPIDELMAVMENAINNGYTFAWGADVSEQGFTRNGVAVCPDVEKGAELTGSDMAHWLGLSPADKRKELTAKPLPEITVTQEMRQEAFDNWETTDDHGMVIYGIAKDQNGKEYFMVKNSWGTEGKYKGIWYASKTFVAYKTMNILVHKKAIPADIAKKLGL